MLKPRGFVTVRTCTSTTCWQDSLVEVEPSSPRLEPQVSPQSPVLAPDALQQQEANT